MNIKIGGTKFEINKQIYISPNGDDANDGLSESTPILTIARAEEISEDNDAIFFMEGDHVFNNTLTYTDNVSINVAVLRNSEGKNIIFYSNPLTTSLTFNITSTPSRFGRVQLIGIIGAGDLRLVNLNINFNVSQNSCIHADGYNALFLRTDEQVGKMYVDNCLFKLDIPANLMSFSHGIVKDDRSIVQITNSNIINNNEFIKWSKGYNFYISVKNSLLSNSTDCINFIKSDDNGNNQIIGTDVYGYSYNEIMALNQNVLKNKMGLFNGLSTMWIKDKYLLKDKLTSETYAYINGIKSIVDYKNSSMMDQIPYRNIFTLSDHINEITNPTSILKIKIK